MGLSIWTRGPQVAVAGLDGRLGHGDRCGRGEAVRLTAVSGERYRGHRHDSGQGSGDDHRPASSGRVDGRCQCRAPV